MRRPFVASLAAIGALAFSACGDDDDASAPSNDAGVDVVTNDAGSDAPVDAGPTYCTSETADFCGDFDRGPTPGFGWGGVDVQGGGALALEPATDTSKPNVLKASLPALDGTGPNAAIATVATKLPLGGKKKVTVALAANIGDTKPAANHIVGFLTMIVDGNTIVLLRGEAKWFLSIARRNTSANDATEPTLKVEPPIGKWFRLELEVVFARPNGSVRLLIDGQEALSEPAVATIGDAPPVSDELTLGVGPSHASGATAASDSRYDDVTVKLAP